MNNTSFGHNVEFAWLLNHTLNILGKERSGYRGFLKIYDHCHRYGIDWSAAASLEGPHDGPVARKTRNWQQAECQVSRRHSLTTKYLCHENATLVMDHVITTRSASGTRSSTKTTTACGITWDTRGRSTITPCAR